MIASKLMNLVPSVISGGSDIDYDDLVSLYEDDLPSSAVVGSEVLRWKAKREG